MLHTLLFLAALASSAVVVAQCPPLGSTLPVAPHSASDTVVQETIVSINQTLTDFVSSLNSTAFTITLGTTKSDTPLLSFHNAPTLYSTSGNHSLSTDTQFVIASVSKLFTAYGIKLLSDRIKPTDRITKFIPELNFLKGQARSQNAISSTDWNDITIEALLSHLSGIVEDLGNSDIDNAPGNYSALGLPFLNATGQGTQCGDASNPYQRPCTEADFFDHWGQKYPAYAPFTTPVYSNVGFAILGLVIERVTGMPFAQYMRDAIFQPLDLQHTSVDRPLHLSDAFITQETGDGDISEGFLAR